MQGPTALSLSRDNCVRTPSWLSDPLMRPTTAQLKACSVYPPSVAVPDVLHGLVPPRPFGTCCAIDASFTALWPGSRKTDDPARPAAARGAATVATVSIAGAAPATFKTSRLESDPGRPRAAGRSLIARW